MNINISDSSQIKINADSYEVISKDKSRQQLKQIFSRYSKVKQITLEFKQISSKENHSELIKRALKDQLININRFDAIIDLKIQDLLSFHYDGTLVSQQSKVSRNSLLKTEDLALENHIIYLDYIVYNQFYVNVSFRILNDISPAQDKKQVIENLFYYLSHMIDFSLENVLSIENIILTQIKIKLQEKYKIDCSFSKVKFHSYLREEGSFSYCIIGLMKIFYAREIDLFIDEDCIHELLEHIFHEDNRLKAKQINSMKIKAFSKQDQKQYLLIQFDGQQLKIEYGSDQMQIPGYTLENLFYSFANYSIKVIFRELKTINCLKEMKRIFKYSNLCNIPKIQIIAQSQDFYITQDQNLKNPYSHKISFTANDFSIKQVTFNTFIISQYPEYDSNQIGESINKYLIKLFNTINVRVYRYSYYIESPIKQHEQAIKKQEEQILKQLTNSKCFNNVLDIRINNNLTKHKKVNFAQHSLLALLKQLKIQNKQNILRKEIILEMSMLFLKSD